MALVATPSANRSRQVLPLRYRHLSRRWLYWSGSSTADSRPGRPRCACRQLLRRPSSAGCRAPLAALRSGPSGRLTPVYPVGTRLRLGETGHWLPLLRGLAPGGQARPSPRRPLRAGRSPVALQGHPQGPAVTGAHGSRSCAEAPDTLTVRCSSGPLAAARISQAANHRLTPVIGGEDKGKERLRAAFKLGAYKSRPQAPA